MSGADLSVLGKLTVLALALSGQLRADDLERVAYNHPGLAVRLGVGLWASPLPMDYDGDGDLDLLVTCNDKPYGGVYFFENPGGDAKSPSQNPHGGVQRPGKLERSNGFGTYAKMPLFKPGVRLGRASRHMRVSHVDGKPRILIPGHELVDFRKRGFDSPVPIYPTTRIHDGNIRANQWSLVDYDGDGRQDLIVGVGDWSGYGWDNAFNAQGEWLNDRLHGYVYLMRNIGTKEDPEYAPKELIRASGAKVDVFGWPSPSFADFDGDGDLDLICGEFLDRFTYFENTGSRTRPQYITGRRLTDAGRPLRMALQMIVPTAIDWDRDGDIDLIVGDEDGSVALIEHSGEIVDGLPHFSPPKYFMQEAADLKFGVLVTPFAYDWDGDGDEDLLCGNTAGQIGWFENLGDGDPPRWAAVELLKAAGNVIHIQAGPNGSIQGPCEAKWGYTTLSVADWDHDGLPDLVVNSIWGKVVWYRNVGSRQAAVLAAARTVEVAWPGHPPKPRWFWWDPTGKQLVTQWRTTPMAVDFTRDGLTDLVMLDQEGYLALFERGKVEGQLQLLPPRRVFVTEDGQPLQLSPSTAGGSGRRKIMVVDWDGDGRLDLLVNSSSADWWRNCATRDGRIVLKPMGPLGKRNVAGHTTSPAVVDWNGDGRPDLLVGAEDGHLYYMDRENAMKHSDAEKEPRSPATAKGKAQRALPGVVAEEFVFTKARFRGCHASTIAETSAGLVAAWFGGTEEGHRDVGIWVSRHNGGGWSTPVEVANGVQHANQPNGNRERKHDEKAEVGAVAGPTDPTLRYPCWNPVLYQEPRGPLMLFYKCGPSPRAWWGMVTHCHDGGRVWSTPSRLPEGIDGPVKNKPIRLPDGDLLCGSSTEYDGWRVHFERTGDLGRTWIRSGPINDGKQFNAIQPSILTHADGRLQILCRSREGRVTMAWSKDGGATWGPMTATELPNPNSGTDAVTLADGRQLLVYNHTLRNEGSPRGRQMLNVAVSEDGVGWKAALVLENEPGEFSYPAVIQTGDGLVHITYTWKRSRIKHVAVDPAQLELREMPDGQWPL